MKIDAATIDKQTVILHLSGELVGGPEGAQLIEIAHMLRESGAVNLGADLSRVEFVNSSGLGMLISVLVTCRNGGGGLVLQWGERLANQTGNPE